MSSSFFFVFFLRTKPMTRDHNPEFDRTLPLRHPTLTMPHGVRQPGRLVFPEYPNLIIKLPATAVNILVTLFVAWARKHHLPADDRGWLNKQSAHATYQEQTGQTLDVDSVSKNRKRLMDRLDKVFKKLGVDPPSLIERDDRGTHLTRRIIIKDLTGKWKAPEEARSEAESLAPIQPSKQLRKQQRPSAN